MSDYPESDQNGHPADPPPPDWAMSDHGAETRAERRLSALAVSERTQAEMAMERGDTRNEQFYTARRDAIDCGREALARAREIVSAYDGYRGRGVMPAPDEYARMVQAIEAARALLTRAQWKD